jgi:AcrR family transcriptional regulator
MAIDEHTLSRDRIVAAARELFAEKGFDAVSIAELAAGAEVNRALIYYYFEDKLDLYRAAVESVLAFLPDLWAKDEVLTGPPADRLDAFIRAMWQALERNRDFVKLIIREVATGGAASEAIFKKYLAPNFIFVKGILDEGVARGELAAVDTAATALALISGVVLPNLGFSIVGRYIPAGAEVLRDEDVYLDNYRELIRRALAASRRGDGDRRGESD